MTSAATHLDPVSYLLRQADANDVPFLCNSWVRSYLKDSRWLTRDQVEQANYFDGQRALVGTILERCGALIACNPDSPTQIYGYGTGEHIDGVAVLHWVYVKQSFRNMGIAKRLFGALRGDAESVYCTHWSQLCAGKSGSWGIAYNPYLAVRL